MNIAVVRARFPKRAIFFIYIPAISLEVGQELTHSFNTRLNYNSSKLNYAFPESLFQ